MAKRNSEIIKNYLTKFPNTPTLTLAKKIYAENRLEFTDVEHARSVIRNYRGQLGGKNRKHLKDKTHFKEAGSHNPFKLPESYAVERKPFKLPLADNNILVLSDLHFPYQNNEAISIAMQYGLDAKVNTIFLLGDVLDFFQCSRFEKTPHKRSIAQEFDSARQFFTSLRIAFPTQNIYWIKGNHDERYEKWLYVKAPEIFDVEDFQLDVLLRLNDFKIKIIESDVLVKFGKLNVSHGHHVTRGVFAPVNTARAAYLKAKSSIMVGHSHQVSQHVEKTVDGDIISCWSVGCLCELRPDYEPLNTKASHGFAHVRVEKNGDYHVDNKMIFNGKLL